MSKSKGRRRVRRSHMKTYSSGYINTGRQPNIRIMQEYQARAAGVDNMTLRLFGVIDDGPPNEPRITALKRRLEIMLADVPKERNVAFINTKRHKLFMFFSKTRAFLVDADLVLGTIKRSLHYGDAHEAIHAFKHRHIKPITWVENIEFALPPSMTSSGTTPPE